MTCLEEEESEFSKLSSERANLFGLPCHQEIKKIDID
jgi:hypothetical protein